jgi:phage gp29-like protein
MKFNLPSASSIVNRLATIVKRTPDEQNAFKKFRAQTLYRTRQDNRDFDQALQAAESVVNPSRYLLYKLYKSIELDTHLTSVVQSRRLKAISSPFRVVKKSGKESPERTALLQAAWFQELLEQFWDSTVYGYSLVQLNELDAEQKFRSLELVPRQNVRPSVNLVVNNPGDVTGYDYSADPWLVGAGKPQDLGLYMKAAKLILYKQHATAAWAQFVELFGMPLRLGKTDMSSPDMAQAMFKMLGEMGSGGYGVIDKADEVEFVETKSNGTSPHLALISYIDAQISKLIWGQTMMSDNGSSRSQSEVHERLTSDYVRLDQRNLTNYVNDNLFPKLIELGFPLEGYRFEFYEVEDTDSLFDQVTKLLTAGFAVDPEFIANKFGIPVTKEAEQPVPNDTEPV